MNSLRTSHTPVMKVMVRMFAEQTHQPRVPLIKFIGKRDLTKPHPHSSHRPSQTSAVPIQEVLIVAAPVQASTSSQKPAFTPKPVKPHHPNAVDYHTLKAGFMHGRKKLAADEILAIELGGASAVI
eukprot:gene5648-6070_t